MTIPKTLLAKSVCRDVPIPEAATLRGHTGAVMCAVDLLLAERGAALCDAFGWSGNEFARFSIMLRMAAGLHDLGKANEYFQDCVRRITDFQQPIRHEQISCALAKLILVHLELNDDERQMVAWAVLGHHRQFPNSKRDGSSSARIFSRHPDFENVVSPLLGNKMGQCSLPTELKINGRGSLFSHLQQECTDADANGGEWGSSKRLLLAALKDSLIVADVLGSASGKAIDLFTWVAAAWRNVATAAVFAEIASKRLNGMPPRRFQGELRDSPSRLTLALAGCGSGKTVGAYLWAASKASGRKLFFCYPTTGTATEGFRDYLAGEDAVLSHSRAPIDVEIFKLDDHEDIDADSLKAQIGRAIYEWDAKIIDCTVDLVLGIVHNARSSIYAWPSLVNGAFVFDEIHSYDETLWKSLLVFLRTFHVPCLLMTASLPDHRLRELTQLADELGESLCCAHGPVELEALPRYQRANPLAPIGRVQQEWHAGGKVLWVANTVNACLSVADDLKECNPCVYHSRFKYLDRVKRHGELIASFKSGGAALATCTQVAEMSLDLSATLLVTELAPIPALIQRLGRLNRRATPDHPLPAAPFVVLEPVQVLPYTEADLLVARDWLGALGMEVLSQSDLTRLWLNSLPPPVGGFQNEWLDGLMQTRPGPIREGSFSISVIMAEDVEHCAGRLTELPKYLIPMPPPHRLPWRSWPMFGYARVAPAGTVLYSEMRGAQWLS